MGWAAIVVSVLLWLFGFIFAKTSWVPPVQIVIPGAFTLAVLSVGLPIMAARKASRLWLLMLLSPAAGYFVLMTNACG